MWYNQTLAVAEGAEEVCPNNQTDWDPAHPLICGTSVSQSTIGKSDPIPCQRNPEQGTNQIKLNQIIPNSTTDVSPNFEDIHILHIELVEGGPHE